MESIRPKYIGGNVIITNKVMRERDPNDFYETEAACVRAYLLSDFIPMWKKNILDTGAGTGVWGKAVKQVCGDCTITGVDIQRFEKPPEYTYWYTADYVSMPDFDAFDIILGNPPYKHGEAFLDRSVKLLRSYVTGAGHGMIIYLLRLGFLASESRFESLWTNGMAPSTVTVLNTRPSFTNDGKTYPGDFAIFRWDFFGRTCDERKSLRFLTYERE